MKHQQLSNQEHDEQKDEAQYEEMPTVKEYTSIQLKAIKVQGWACVLGGISLHLILGSFYLWGGISLYATSYFKTYDNRVTIYHLASVFPIQNLMTNIILSFGVRMGQYFGFKTIIFTGGMLHAFSCLVGSFITNSTYFIILYGVFGGIATGLVYMLPILCGWKYFPSNRGRVSSVILIAYGFGAFALTLISQQFINPKNIQPTTDDIYLLSYSDLDIQTQFPIFLRALSALYVLLTLVSVCLVRFPKQIKLEQQQAFRQMTQMQERNRIQNQTLECKSLRQGLKSKSFFHLMFMIIFSTQVSMLMANAYKINGFHKTGLDDFNLSISGAIAFLANSCLRGSWTRIMDKYGFKKVYTSAIMINLITIPILTLIYGFWPYLITLTIIITCGGGMLACFPSTTTKVFGYKVGPAIYGLLFIGVAFSNLIAYLLMINLTNKIGFEGVLWICFGSNICALILGLMFKQQVDWKY